MGKVQIIAQCAHCHHKRKLRKTPTKSLKCTKCRGPIHIYTSRILSPEEIAAKYGPPGSPVPKVKKEEISMSDFTKEKYLQMRLGGKGRTAIMNELFPSNKVKFYRYLKEWGIKEQEAEEQALDLLQAELKAKQAEAPTEASEASTESPEPAPEPAVIETPAAKPDIVQEPVAEPAIALVEDRETYQISPAATRSKRSMRIEVSGSSQDIEEELMAMLSYIQVMPRKSFRLELYLGEVAE